MIRAILTVFEKFIHSSSHLLGENTVEDRKNFEANFILIFFPNRIFCSKTRKELRLEGIVQKYYLRFDDKNTIHKTEILFGVTRMGSI